MKGILEVVGRLHWLWLCLWLTILVVIALMIIIVLSWVALWLLWLLLIIICPVSYTHLDVYKRQLPI